MEYQTLTEQIDETKLKIFSTNKPPVDWDWIQNHSFMILECPCCEKKWWKSYNYDLWRDKYYSKKEVYNRQRNNAIWELEKRIVRHINNEVRLNGCVKHMNLLLELFGEKKGKEILLKMAHKSRLVADSIEKFMDAVSVNKEREEQR